MDIKRSATLRLALVAVCSVLQISAGVSAQGRAAGVRPFILEEATIAGIHSAFASHQLTCVDLVSRYLKRIDAYDHKGPNLNSVLTINAGALKTAAELDKKYASGPSARAALHCIPVLLKDNYSTVDMPTTAGAKTLANEVPVAEATIVKRLREAGVVIIGKSNLTELALAGTTVSSLGGQTRNPYDLTRTPGGSSGGTGAAIASNLAAGGTGSDTGNSVRSPASANSVVGIRPTRGLVSRYGIVPVSLTQDEAGPITRTVEDAARMLDVMAGYDPSDPITAFGIQKVAKTYTAFLDPNGLKGRRIGLLTDFLGRESIHSEVNRVVEEDVLAFERLGATIVRINIPQLDTLSDVSVIEFEFKIVFNQYLARFMPNASVRTLDEFMGRGEFHPTSKTVLESSRSVVDGMKDREYERKLQKRVELRQAVMKVMADYKLDAILYPHQQRLVAAIGEPQLERNGVLSNGTGFPAITFPGGFSKPSATAPLGIPIGIELLGPDWSEPELIRMAYAFEQNTRLRKPPASTPSIR